MTLTAGLPNAPIVVYVQARQGYPVPGALEALAVGQALARDRQTSLVLLLIGHRLDELAHTVAGYGASRVCLYDGPELAFYSPISYAQVLVGFTRQIGPELVLAASTPHGNELVGRASAVLRAGMLANCDSLIYDQQGRLQAHRKGCGGQIEELLAWNQKRPAFATLQRAKGVPALSAANLPSEITRLPCPPLPVSPVTFEGELPDSDFSPDLEEAEIVVAGGRGVGSAEGFRRIEDVARLLGAAVGASLVAVEEGWQSRGALLGQTGKTVAPRLLLSFGISGALHHLVGVRDAQVLVAFNTDRQAPIFRVAQLKVVADVQKLLPVLISALDQEVSRAPDQFRLTSASSLPETTETTEAAIV